MTCKFFKQKKNVLFCISLKLKEFILLKHLSIQNYALIERLDIDFSPGYSVITGETGAGKSILLGALSLILGNRADTNVLKNKAKKCTVEAEFDIQRYSIKLFFDENDIDYDEITVIRREILPEGRSRAFVNDMPVTLNVLKELGMKLTDIHSQHQNLNLNNNEFQLNVLDAFAKLQFLLNDYQENFRSYKQTLKTYKDLSERAEKEKADYDFLQFRFEELEEAKLKPGEQSEIENELAQLNHAREIIENLTKAFALLSDEENGVLGKLRTGTTALKQIQKYFVHARSLSERFDSMRIEAEDIAGELEKYAEDVEHNPERMEFLTDRINTIYALQTKHKVETVEELLLIQEDLQTKLDDIVSFDGRIKEAEKQIEEKQKLLQQLADNLSAKRAKAALELEANITEILQRLGMPSSVFKINLEKTSDFTETGTDYIRFLFSSTKHFEAKDIASIASGGEISRLMLALKSIISESIALPVIIFDEIDTGVSGEIAEKIGQIMKEMSDNMQVLSITHLPQVAAKADAHYKVFKLEDDTDTRTDMKKLSHEERIRELASILSGENISEAALNNARALLES